MPKQNIDFLVIGAQKSGTTSLFKYIQQHPSLYLPPQKEINFFANEDRYSKGVDWYIRTYFSSAAQDKLWGEVSPHYMGYSCAAPRIHEAFPDVKLVAILRNPIDRAYSQYRMAVRRGVETRTFGEVISDQRTAHLGLPETEVGEDWRHCMLSFSMYGNALENYLRYFDKEQLLLLFQEDLLNYPHRVTTRFFSSLGVDETYEPPNLGKRYHEGGAVRIPGLDSWLRQRKYLKRLVKRALISKRNVEAVGFWFEQLNIKAVRDKGPSAEERRVLKETLEGDVALLKKLFSINPPWPEFEGTPPGGGGAIN